MVGGFINYIDFQTFFFYLLILMNTLEYGDFFMQMHLNIIKYAFRMECHARKSLFTCKISIDIHFTRFFCSENTADTLCNTQ